MTNMQGAAWLEWFKAIFDLLKGISWPLALFLVIWIFREPIRARIPFVIQLGPTGAVFQPGQQPDQGGANPLQTVSHPLPTVNDLATSIQEELLAFVPEQREQRLVRALAEARVMADFEFIFANIFQSQIDALSELASGPKAIAEAKEYFEETVRPMNKELYSRWDFEQWSAYLLSQKLVEVENGTVQITQKGIDFLDFVRRYKVGFHLSN
ncbi:hypothetical protein ACU8MT_08460 [Rhizobium leguminosarum]